MITDEQRFLFDLQGYVTLPGVLPPEVVKQMQADMDRNGIANPENNPAKSRFGNFLKWGPVWRNLIDHPAILPFLGEFIGPKFRLDHIYGMAMSTKGARGGEGLHHEGGMFNHGCYYVTHGQRIHNGLVVVSFALCDVPPGAGGFCCIPGTHKSIFPLPKGAYQVDHPLVRHVPMKAGDVLIFTEALTHGTMPWAHEAWERRAVLLKYCPHYMQWSKVPADSSDPELTERQKLIMQGAYVWERPAPALT